MSHVSSGHARQACTDIIHLVHFLLAHEVRVVVLVIVNVSSCSSSGDTIEHALVILCMLLLTALPRCVVHPCLQDPTLILTAAL
jgi:hypothetical protein